VIDRGVQGKLIIFGRNILQNLENYNILFGRTTSTWKRGLQRWVLMILSSLFIGLDVNLQKENYFVGP
jgi:hypothetical protein